jgi:hypothetical protein
MKAGGSWCWEREGVICERKGQWGEGDSGNNLWGSKLDVAASLVMVATGGGVW